MFGFHLAYPVEPEVMLVFDRSSAMRKPSTGSSLSRWMEMTDGVATVLGTQTASWGLKFYPNGEMCQVASGVDVSVAAGHLSEVISKIRNTQPATGTEGSPIPAAVSEAVNAFPRNEKPRFLVLASDGQPGCPPTNKPDSEMALRSYDAVDKASLSAVRTFVVGTAVPGTSQHTVLNELATRGKEPVAGATRYRAAQNKLEMMTVLTDITEQLGRCLLRTKNAPIDANAVVMDIDGVRVKRDPAYLDGWNYGPDFGRDGKSFRLYGSACAKLRANPGATVEMTYGCPGVSPP